MRRQIAELNLKIVTTEGGEATGSDAGGLRSQRNEALKRLAEIADIKVSEQRTGATNVSIGGQFLVFEGRASAVEMDTDSVDGMQRATIQFAETNNPLEVAGGELHGIYEARDTVAGGFLTNLDNFAASLANEFNKIFASGQGITGFSEVTSTASVSDTSTALDEAGLDFTPANGKFDLLVYNTETGLTETTTITVDLNGVDGDTTLASLASAINAVDGVTASISFDNELVVRSDSSELEFSFQDDTSGFLAAIGINTFFTGSKARTLGVNGELLADGSKFAASNDGIGVGTGNAVALVALHDQSLDSLDDNTLTGLYDKLVNDLTQGATVAGAVADGLRVFESSLEASTQAVSGVNLDEEAIRMIALQRTYQATAKYITTLSELLDILVSL